MKSWLLGIELWHIINGATWHGAHLLKRATQGAKSATPLSSIEPKQAPMTLAHLIALCCGLDLKNTFNVTIFSTATVDFWCQCWLAEVSMDEAFDPAFHASQSCPPKLWHRSFKYKISFLLGPLYKDKF